MNIHLQNTMQLEMNLASFSLDESVMVDQIVRETVNPYAGRDDLTAEELLKAIAGQGIYTTTSNRDHPDFAALRNLLEEQGYISTQRGFWNGDRVLKPFLLNGVEFKQNGKFPCAAAMRHHIEWKRKHPEHGDW